MSMPICTFFVKSKVVIKRNFSSLQIFVVTFYSVRNRHCTGCGSIHGGNPALSALKYFGPNIRDTEHKEYLSPFPYDVL